MLDIVVYGGTAVLPSGPEPADIGVAGERIAAIGAPGSLAALGARRVVDAAGQIVIPGGIDPHVHCNWPMPMPGVAQPTLTEPASRVSLAAMHGGTTKAPAAVPSPPVAAKPAPQIIAQAPQPAAPDGRRSTRSP